MKKTWIIALAAAGVLVFGGGAVYAAGQISQANAIGEEHALNLVFADAGIQPEQADAVITDFEFENGKYVYDVEFTAQGQTYEYTIEASSGRILARETGYAKDSSGTAATARTDPAVSQPVQSPPSDSGSSLSADLLTEKEAAAIALKDAGLNESEVTFMKVEKGTENGEAVFEVDFTYGGTEYEYDISAATGAIVKHSTEEKNSPASGTVIPAETVDHAAISLEEAKSIALKDAGCSADTAVFTKAKIEKDDGRLMADIEFSDGINEYEYTIDVYTGEILEAETDRLNEVGAESASRSSRDVDDDNDENESDDSDDPDDDDPDDLNDDDSDDWDDDSDDWDDNDSDD